LRDQLGGEDALADWMATYGYTLESFGRALTRSISAAWMRDQIIAAVPKGAEQVHARQILLYNSEQASEVYAQLEAGNDFGNLALQYDPLTGGDLGWIPRGYLPDADLEEAAFMLELEQYSPVIETLAGFHILQVIGRDPQRPLPPEALVIVQTQMLQEWLEARRDGADIQLMLP
jgi:parvulin-like peptidyl-prolyl isomerase